jgi:Integral membrane protein TerC family
MAAGEEYFAGYLLEQSLSVDNLFVFLLCFNFFKTPQEYQGRVLNVGIWTAALLRGVMIIAGVELVENFKPVLLVFALVLLYSSFKIVTGQKGDEDEDLSDNIIVRAVNKVCSPPSSPGDDGVSVVRTSWAGNLGSDQCTLSDVDCPVHVVAVSACTFPQYHGSDFKPSASASRCRRQSAAAIQHPPLRPVLACSHAPLPADPLVAYPRPSPVKQCM